MYSYELHLFSETHKSEVFSVFVTFYDMLKTQYLATRMVHPTSCLDTPQHSVVAERKNHTLLEITRSLLIECRSPSYVWPEAIATVAYLTNRIPSKPLNYKTPLETIGSFFSLPSFHSLSPCIFGCVVFVHLPKQSRTKLEARAIQCVFVGYGGKSKRLSMF